jgi:Icc-related predicted phosphoesterase
VVKITCISDTHNRHKQIDVGSGDILLHAGDATGLGKSGEIEAFLKWYGEQEYTHKIFVPGNHDWGFEKEPDRFKDMCEEYGVTLLNDSGITIEDIKIWGSPVQPTFCNWAFNRSITGETDPHPDIRPHWDMIPEDTDILITHGPPRGILDAIWSQHFSGIIEENVGCPFLKMRIDEVKPRLHVFGHIHNEQGIFKRLNDNTTFINASQLDDNYEVAYTPKTIIWEDGVKIIGVRHG